MGSAAHTDLTRTEDSTARPNGYGRDSGKEGDGAGGAACAAWK